MTVEEMIKFRLENPIAKPTKQERSKPARVVKEQASEPLPKREFKPYIPGDKPLNLDVPKDTRNEIFVRAANIAINYVRHSGATIYSAVARGLYEVGLRVSPELSPADRQLVVKQNNARIVKIADIIKNDPVDMESRIRNARIV